MGLRIATYNIHRCIGGDGGEDCGRIAAVLREINADIVAVQEIASGRNQADVLAYLAKATGTRSFAGFTFTAAGAAYGNALLAKPPAISINRLDISVAGREPRGVIEAAFQLNHLKLRLWATHLGLGFRERRRQMSRLVEAISTSEADIDILLGDLNEWRPWSRALVSLQHWFAASGSTHPPPATFPARRPFLKLDRFLIRPIGRLTALRAHRTELSRIASDHLPVVADIRLDR